MSSHNKHPIKLPVNRLMWDSLAVEPIDFQIPHDTCYAGSTTGLLTKMPKAQYNVLLDMVAVMPYPQTSLVVYSLLKRIWHVGV